MKTTILSALMGLFVFGAANAADMTIYYSPTCPHCHHAKEFTSNNFIYEYPTINVTMVDVTVPEHRTLFMDVLKTCNFSSGGVPVIKIGEKCFQGFGEGMADDLRSAIEVDLSADAKTAAANAKKGLAENADKYREEHPTPVANITEYVSPAEEAEVQKKTEKSDNNIASWMLAIAAIAIFALGVIVYRKKSKK